ncbi:MAG: SGNH/GDSL hydrolase family protein, partial [Sulfuricella sp.]
AVTGPNGVRTINDVLFEVPRKGAVLGDSIAALCLTYSATASKYSANSWLNQAQFKLGFPWDIQAADNFAIAGTTSAVILSDQVPLFVASGVRYERVFMSFGTNDFNAGETLANVISNAKQIFAAINNTGAIAVHIGVLPRGSGASMTTPKKKALGFNAWLARYATENAGIEYIPCGQALADNSTAFGNAITGFVDGSILHPIDPGAYWMGKIIYDFYINRGYSAPTLRFADSAADFYDATYNPGGILFTNPNPLLIGGTTAPTGMSTAGSNVTWSKGTNTLDNGQVEATAKATMAGVQNAYLYDDILATGAWDTENIAEGDDIYAQAIIKCTGLVSDTLPFLQVTENNGTGGGGVLQNAYCNDATSGTRPTIPDGTYYLRTPNITVRPYSGAGNASVFAKLNIVSTGAETGVIEILRFELRKANII